ncbi:histone deacetylase HDT2 [Rosa rugosa]|uniref:histone deacetylase HDT2 n=1 Tax=Rosa rugosa TaxID=74645 RepID=UPI002B40CBD7|nr:histone deacetylase HDT2 [Rosa rugosa]
MGCFLACFGISKKRKRRRLSNRVAAAGGDSRRGSYVPLDSSSLAIIGLDGPKVSPNSAGSEQLRDKPKEATSFKVRKKVSFNLNVQTYEPISNDYDFVESEEEEEEVDNNGQEGSKGRSSTSASKRASTALSSSIGLFPSNYRYQNVRDSYDSYEEEDYVADEESDLDDDDYYGDDDYCDGDSDMDDPRMSQEGFPKQSFSSSINGELESCRWNLNAGDNIPYAHSVLSPIENLSQWKAAKAKIAAPKQQKENVPSIQEPRILYSRSSCNQSKPLLQEIPVHASLSSWIK